MSWKKYFRTVKPSNASAQANQGMSSAEGSSNSKFASFLPEVYAGNPHRIQRYYQYADMDTDADIASALDIIADFCTQSEEQTDSPFIFDFGDDATETQVSILKKALIKWTKLNDFRQRLFEIFRSTIMNGDQFFLRDPETAEWLWLNHYMVEFVKVDEENGKTPEEYLIRGLELNLQAKFGSAMVDPNEYRLPLGSATTSGGRGASANAATQPSNYTLQGSGADPRSRNSQGQTGDQLSVINAKHIVHLSMTVGMDPNWPFGKSILEPVFKTYKQKSMLEDAILIYRVMRAPERRIFKIDVGSMPPNRAAAYVAQVKNDIHQRRIPNRSGGGSSMMDAAYNPLAMCDDYFFAQGQNGRGSSVETLPGGDSLGEITDLKYFSKRMWSGMKIPPSYLTVGDEQGASYQDGKIGTALIQEFMFNKYCMRLQALLAPVIDTEFKYFARMSGLNIDEDMYEVRFNPPQNFGKYRQIELDAQQMQVYSQVAENKKLSERFKLSRFMGLTEEEIIENERLWKEENADKIKKKTGAPPSDGMGDQGLSNVGVRSGDTGMDFNPDDFGSDGEAPDGGADNPDLGGDLPPDAGGGMPPDGGAGAPPPPG